MKEQIFRAMRNDGFIITIESLASNTSFESLGLNVAFSRSINNQKKILLLSKVRKFCKVDQKYL